MGFKETIFNLAEKVGDTADKCINKGKDGYNKMAEKNQVKKDIVRLNKEIDNLFMSVGRKIYNEDRGNEKFKVVFGDADAKMAEVAELKNRLSILDGAVPCPSCGTATQNGEAVCTACGTKIAEEPQDAEVEIVEPEQVCFCSKCGANLDNDAKFCKQCGNKVAD